MMPCRAFQPCLQDCVGYEDAPLGMQAIKAAGFLKASRLPNPLLFPHVPLSQPLPLGSPCARGLHLPFLTATSQPASVTHFLAGRGRYPNARLPEADALSAVLAQPICCNSRCAGF